ncbi:MAG: hypothetical protein A2505_01310 [Deltaproteobacteria bacterium RIFOXYD12_FULL_55_16]|nr:MAG: hypothetical protein A2505_01310 [Deltaproteobacteria bacterium RIFOXYD12_FULL_55_16]
MARITAGTVNEDSSMLGVTGSAAFKISGANTSYVSFSGAYNLTANDSLLAQISSGTSKSSGNSLINDSETKTISWSLGLLHQNTWRQGDKFALTVSQPMKVTSGSMNLLLPTVDADGVGGFQASRVDLTSDKTETDFEIGYMAPMSKASSVYFNTAYKQNVGNTDENATVTALRFMTSF